MRRLAFLLMLAFVASIPLNSVLSLGAVGSTNKFIGFAAAGAWMVTFLTSGRLRHPAPFHLAVFSLLFWALLSLVVWSEAIRDVFALPMLVVMVALIWDQCKTRLDIDAVVQAYVVGTSLATASLLYNYGLGASIQVQNIGSSGVYRGVADRFAAAGTGPNELGVMLAAGVAMAAYLIVNRPFSSKWIHRLNIVFIPAGIFSIALTGSRTASVSLVVALVFLVSSFRRLATRSMRQVFAGGLAVSVLAIQEFVPDLTMTRFLGTVDSAIAGDFSSRDIFWREGLEAFVEHPFLGVGAFAYRLNTPSGKAAHNVPIELSTELGMVGAVLFFIAVLYAVRAALAMRKRGEGLWLTLLLISIPGVLTLSWTYEKYLWLVLSMVVAAAAARSPVPGDVPGSSVPDEPPDLGAAEVGALAAWQSRRYGRAASRPKRAPVRTRWER